MPKPNNVIAFPAQSLGDLPSIDEVLEMTEQETDELIERLL